MPTTAVRIYEFRKNRLKECRTFLVGVHEITLTRELRNRMAF
jgi:hypothetical protein